LIARIGKIKYDEELEVLRKCKEQEDKDGASGGKFVTKYGDVDTRVVSSTDV